MKMLKGAYFPGVRPDEVWISALRHLVESLVVYGVVDDEAAGIGWEVRLVAPLGSDSSRFSSLLREMTGRDAAVIRGQMLALASRSGRDRDEATVGSLTGALHRVGGDQENLEKSRVERIWQARLFLKLAEAVTAAESEVGLALDAVANRQAEMMQALQGGDDDAADELLPPPSPQPRPVPRKSFRIREQLAAWAVFYLLDPGPELLLLTDDPEAADLLADEVEKRVPGQVISLPMLNLAMEGNERVAVVKALQEILTGKVEGGLADLQAAVEPQTSSPAAVGVAPMVIQLRLFPSVEFRQVMVELSGLPGNKGAIALASPFVLVGAIAPGEAYL